jgi:hypothetical protein
VWTSQAAMEASIEVSPEGLFTRRNRRLTFGGATPGTSLFSERMRRRWELQDQEICAQGDDHTAYATRLQGRRTRREEVVEGGGLLRGGGPAHVQLQPAARQAPSATAGRPATGQAPGAAAGRLAGTVAGQVAGQAAGRTPGQGPAPAARRSSCMHNSAPKQNGNWTDSQLEGALLAYEQRCSVNGAAALFDIPRTSFCTHLSGTVLSRKRGAAPVLTELEE